MPRTKGAKNKPKTIIRTNNSIVVKTNLEKQVENQPLTRDTSRGWISWGSSNLYPMELTNLYYNSLTHKACIDFAVTSILGGGVDYDAMKMDDSQLIPNYQQSWDEVLENLALDYVLYGSFALQIIKNEDGRTYSFYHQPIADVRCSPRDEDGIIPSYWVCSDWTAMSRFPPVNLPAFGFQEDETINSGETYLYVFQKYNPELLYYYSPLYISGIKAIQTEVEMLRYDLRSVLNNFSASGVLTLSRVDNDEERKMIMDNIQSMFTGSDSANGLMVTFRNSDDETPVEFTPFDKQVDNVNLFDGTNDRTVERIIAAHRIPSKGLVGFDLDGASLGGDGNTLNVAYNLYNRVTGNKLRRDIIGAVNNALRLNGIETSLILKPLTFSLTSENAHVDNGENNAPKDTLDDDEISEKTTSENNNE